VDAKDKKKENISKIKTFLISLLILVLQKFKTKNRVKLYNRETTPENQTKQIF
jgi:hypothetical protein